jgi:hypothetical protein
LSNLLFENSDNDQQSDSDTYEYEESEEETDEQGPEFNPEENRPPLVHRAPTNASTGINKELVFQHLGSIVDITRDNEEKTAVAKVELKKASKKIIGVIDGALTTLIFSQQIYTEDVYSVEQWVEEIKMLLNKKYSEEESIVEQGTHSELVQKNGLYAKMYNKQALYYQNK